MAETKIKSSSCACWWTTAG